MQLTIDSSPIAGITAHALLVGFCEGDKLTGDIGEINSLLDGALSEVAGFSDGTDITGKLGEVTTFYTHGKMTARRVLVVGLGKRVDLSQKNVRDATGTVVRQLRDRKVKTVASLLHRSGLPKKHVKEDLAAYASATVEGTILALWEPDSYKLPAERKGSLDTFTVAEPDPKRSEAVRQGVERGRILGESSNLARTLVNEPGNALPPAAMAERARLMAADVGLGCEILDEDAMYRYNMGGILSVSVGSENRARLIVLKHMPRPGEPALALVGKGITFDTGGISIKPTEGMGAMKGDMAGAAAVIGAMRAIALLEIPVNVVGLAPCAENMPSGKAFRPGDVVRFMNGKTSEIITTDAEGRLVLADALTFAIRNLRSARVVDVATLTGACIIALGHIASGAWTNNADWLASVRAASETSGERIWEMPLFDEYRKQINSDIADMKNSGGRPGGAISAAMFIKEFVDDVPWVHLDIAGTSGSDNATHLAKGPSGVMVRTFVHLAEKLAAG
jgi:leucyl aminopeptidase